VTGVNMVGDGDSIQTLPYSLLYASCRPNGSVREDGVQVEVTL
jgi:hypothetical protein